jgi:hypothetical protein
MKFSTASILCALGLAFFGSSTSAQDLPTSNSLALTGDDRGLRSPDDYCPVGQVWPGYDPDWIEPGTITGGGETFFALFDPSGGCACPIGFDVATTDFFMTFPDETPLPITITVSMGLKEAVYDQGSPIPWLPGATVCETPVRDFTIHIPKQYVGFGIALECDCVSMESPFFLFFTIHSVMDPPGGFYTSGGGAPELGRFLTFDDNQWVDLVAAGILTRGDLVVSGSAQCCETPVAVDEPDESLPAVTQFIGTYPNPFNPQISISFMLGRAEWANIGVYDLTGRRVTVLADRALPTGAHTLNWNGRDASGRAMPGGTYIVRLETESGVEARKVMLIR